MRIALPNVAPPAIAPATACDWLASDNTAYGTGEALSVSGGEEMH